MPGKAYLLAYDLPKEKLTERAWLDYVVQGAALAQLLADGGLRDTGTAVVAREGRHLGDEVLEQLLQEVRDGNPRDWRALLHESKATLEAVEDQLVRTGALARRGRRLVALDPGAVAGLQTKVRRILDDGDVARVDRLDGALVALASVSRCAPSSIDAASARAAGAWTSWSGASPRTSLDSNDSSTRCGTRGAGPTRPAGRCTDGGAE